jgi:uncharacterized protein
MTTYNISRTIDLHPDLSADKVASVMRMFGLTKEKLKRYSITGKCTIEIRQGDIVYITGPSGSGKSVLLNELWHRVPAENRINLAQIELPADKALIDCIEGDLLTSLKFLSLAGLNDCFCVINTPANLSDGQKWRFRLACALASGKQFIFADEFCSSLDRITAAVVSYQLRRFAKKHNVTFILAATAEDVLADLLPDVLVVQMLSGPAEVVYKYKT